jgi:glycerol-3-phosphate dehydrogenase
MSSTGLISVLGGKWTTYRKMAEDCVDAAARVADLPAAECRTKSMHVHGHPGQARVKPFSVYGSDAAALEILIASTPNANELLAERLPYVAGQVIFAVRHEMARSVEDVLARRTRALFLDAEAALAAAPRVTALLAAELGRDATWQTNQLEQFRQVADAYRPGSAY